MYTSVESRAEEEQDILKKVAQWKTTQIIEYMVLDTKLSHEGRLAATENTTPVMSKEMRCLWNFLEFGIRNWNWNF